MISADLNDWLAEFGLSRTSFALLIPYFGILHPPIEQAHWLELRKHTSAHFLFAGYHVLVLCTLLSPIWLIICFGILTGVSFLWHGLCQKKLSLIATLSHIFADAGIILSVLLLM